MAEEFPYNPEFLYLAKRSYTIIKERELKHRHLVFDGPPDDWAKERGATHTLFCGNGIGKGTRPAKLLKTVMYVGTDESNNEIVWEKWDVREYMRAEQN